MNPSGMTLADLQAKIAKHAWEDPAFEAEFMESPKATFEKYLGQKLPDTLQIHAHYNTPAELHFVVPKRVGNGSDELSDDDLDRVAGGEVLIATMVVIASVSVGGMVSMATVSAASVVTTIATVGIASGW